MRRLQNRTLKSAMRTAIRKVEEACEGADRDSARSNLAVAMKRIDKCAKRNVVHRNTAARKKSRLARLVGSLG